MTNEKIPEEFLDELETLQPHEVHPKFREWARMIFVEGRKLNVSSDKIAECIIAWAIAHKYVKPHIQQVLLENGIRPTKVSLLL